MRNTMKKIGLLFAVIFLITTMISSALASDEMCEHVYCCASVKEQYLAREATCTTNALYFKSCPCGESSQGTDQEIIFEFEGSYLGHSVEIIPGKEPTCTTDGYTESRVCNREINGEKCGKILKESIKLSATGHHEEYVSVPKKEATCTNAGHSEEKRCLYCGKILKEAIELSATGHHEEYVSVPKKEATCTNAGHSEEKRCLYCGILLTSPSITIPALGHIDDNNDGFCNRCNVMCGFAEGDYLYVVKDDKATIIDVENSIGGNVIIPSTLGGYPVTELGENAFEGCFYIKNVAIPETVVTIGDYAFTYCIALKEIVIPESVTSIGVGSFAYCMSLENLIVKNKETTISEYVAYTDLTVADGYTTEEWVEKYYALIDAESSGTVDESMYDDILSITVTHEEPVAIPTVTIYGYDPSTAKIYAEKNGISFKNISELEEPHSCTFGEWFTETEPTVFSEGISKRVCECGKYETEPIAKLESAVTKHETTKVEVTYTEENFESEVELVVSEEEINANIVFGDEFENFKSYDISLEAYGEKVQPKGLVTVKLPIPADFNAETTVVYYVDDNGNKTKLESTIENGYIIFETDHFSEYVLVDESSKIHKHSYTTATVNPTCTESGSITYTCTCGDTYTETLEPTGHTFNGSECTNCDYDKADECDCKCHTDRPFAKFFFKIKLFFWKLFKKNAVCDCGMAHY